MNTYGPLNVERLFLGVSFMKLHRLKEDNQSTSFLYNTGRPQKNSYGASEAPFRRRADAVAGGLLPFH
jgi:hypothetical protein